MLSGSIQVPVALVILFSGLLACFLGYRLFRVVLGVYGFLAGVFLSQLIAGPLDPWPRILAALAGGAMGVLFSVVAYVASVALVGAALGAAVVSMTATQLGRDPTLVLLVAVSIVGAFAALALQRYVLILATAFAGAWSILVAASALASGPGGAGLDLRGDAWLKLPWSLLQEPWTVLVWIVLGLLGMFVQLPSKRKR